MPEKHLDQNSKRKAFNMKNYEEMARLVLEARDEYVKKKRKRITIVKKVSASLCGAAAVLGETG